MKYIVVTGGVLSGLGKGVTTSSIGRILKDKGYKAIPLKIDGYVNVDPGTMNPYEHGEVYVLDDGSETDLDLGHYERFLNTDLTGESNMTTGSIYKTVIEKERKGEYLGKTVQIIPHVTGEIKARIRKFNRFKPDVVLVEIGGTVGDMENMVFIEALRQLAQEPENDCLFVHLAYVPVIASGEQKTKPLQHSVKELLSLGVQPDIIIGRCTKELSDKAKAKISLFCGVDVHEVLSDPDVDNIYKVPLKLIGQDLGGIIVKKLELKHSPVYALGWEAIMEKVRKFDDEVSIAIVGKYTALEDSYLSIKEAFKHAGVLNRCSVNLEWVEASDIDKVGLEKFDGILVPGGFGSRGIEGKIKAIEYARENDVPFLGICLGFQLAVIEFARNVCGLGDANTTEVNPDTKNPVIDLIPEQKSIDKLGGTMRLGAYPCVIKSGTLAKKLYKKEKISERHRHRWEVNPKYISLLEKNGLVFSGVYPDRNLVEILELPDHGYFIASQFHPEFKSRLENPAPLFYGLVEAALKKQQEP